MNKKGSGEHWKQVLCGIVVVLESEDHRQSESARSRFDELLERPIGQWPGDRDTKIRRAFNGTNLSAVKEQFQVSRATIYRAARKRKSHNP